MSILSVNDEEEEKKDEEESSIKAPDTGEVLDGARLTLVTAILVVPVAVLR